MLAGTGFLIGFILGAAFGQDPLFGVAGGTIGLILLGRKFDMSIIDLNLIDNDTDETVYLRCNKKHFKELSTML